MHDLTRLAASDQDVRGLLDRRQVLRTGARRTKKNSATCKPIPKHAQGSRFVRGPIPYNWLCVALSFGGKAASLAWAIWWLAGVKGSNPIRLTQRTLRNFNVSTRTARRLLVKFERAGLIQVDSQRGRGPDVTLLPFDQETITDRTTNA